ncbi:hypothetical protein, partial [Blautia intestinihominis]
HGRTLKKGGIPPDFRCSGNLLPSSSLSPVGSVNVFVVPEAAVTATLSIFRNGAFDCALIFVVVPFTVLLLTNQAYVLDPSATAATHTMATFVTLI